MLASVLKKLTSVWLELSGSSNSKSPLPFTPLDISCKSFGYKKSMESTVRHRITRMVRRSSSSSLGSSGSAALGNLFSSRPRPSTSSLEDDDMDFRCCTPMYCPVTFDEDSFYEASDEYPSGASIDHEECQPIAEIIWLGNDLDFRTCLSSPVPSPVAQINARRFRRRQLSHKISEESLADPFNDHPPCLPRRDTESSIGTIRSDEGCTDSIAL